jgi:hypothetical protein
MSGDQFKYVIARFRPGVTCFYYCTSELPQDTTQSTSTEPLICSDWMIQTYGILFLYMNLVVFDLCFAVYCCFE